MRRPTMGQIIIVGVVVAAIAATVLMPGIWKTLFRKAQGFDMAQTPQECSDYFRKAIKERKYDLAADLYLGGDLREQFKRAATAATELGKATDSLAGQMQVKDMDSPKVRSLMMVMEPFPTEFEAAIQHKDGDTTARIVFTERTKFDFREDPNWNNTLQADVTFFRALSGGRIPVQFVCDLKLDGKGKDKGWRMYTNIDNNYRAQVDRLNAKYKVYKKVLEKLHYNVTHNPMTKADFETEVKTEIETAARDN